MTARFATLGRQRLSPRPLDEPGHRAIAQHSEHAQHRQRLHLRPRDLHHRRDARVPPAIVRDRAAWRRRTGVEARRTRRIDDGSARNGEQVRRGLIQIAPRQLRHLAERSARLAGAIRERGSSSCALPCARSSCVGNVDRVLLLGVAGDVFEDVHRLQRLGECAAPFAKHRVSMRADARRVLVPEIGEEIADRSRHVVAVLFVFVETLDPDAARICERRTFAFRRSFRGSSAERCRAFARGARDRRRIPDRCCRTRRTCAGSPATSADASPNASTERASSKHVARRSSSAALDSAGMLGSSSSVSAMRQMR